MFKLRLRRRRRIILVVYKAVGETNFRVGGGG